MNDRFPGTLPSGMAIMIDEAFFVPRQRVSVVALGDSGEALLVRSILENLGAAVTLHLPGTPADFLLVLAQRVDAPAYLVVCAHGTDDGFVLGDSGSGIDTTMLARGCLPASAIEGRVALPGSIVVSTACETGSDAFGATFLKGQVAAYVAPRGSPDAADAALFVHRLFHQLLRRKAPLRRALEIAGTDEPDAMFVGFLPGD